MNCKLRKKIPKYRSKKGLSLVELLVGITIIAMVMASAAGAIVTGYKTTLDNADRNQAAAKSASLNEVILKGLKNCRFENATDADDALFGTGSTEDIESSSIFQTAKSLFPDVQYISGDFPNITINHDVQYKLDTTATREMQVAGTVVSANTIKGIEIRTAVLCADGYSEIVSFIPYYE